MKVVEAKGTWRAIGEATGEALREEIALHVAQRALDEELEQPGMRVRLKKQMDVLHRELPALHEELLATARGADTRLEYLAAINLPLGYDRSLSDDCTNAAFAGGPDGPIWGKNNDGKHPEIENQNPVVCRKIVPDEGIPQVCFTFAGWIGMADGMNAAGLAAGHSSVGSKFQMRGDAVQVRLWAHWGLHQCRDTKSFIRHMTSRPTRGKGYSYVVVDRSGDAVSLEIPCPLTQVRRSNRADGHVQCVNLYQLDPLREADNRKPAMKEPALRRWEMMDARLAAAAPYGLDQMKDLLRYHGDPGVCRHGAQDVSHTEYSMIGLCAQGKVLFHHGNPCEGDYTEVTV